MIRHIVLMKLRAGPTSHENGLRIRSGLNELVGRVDGLVANEVLLGFGDRYDVCVITDFESAEAFAAYGPHPDHRRMREFIHSVVEDTRPAFDCKL